ncbi:RHS repeat domain-containing protein [Vibrio quintilis]|nr:RHS repeat domain-containing protein [Vibrio quintilis]
MLSIHKGSKQNQQPGSTTGYFIQLPPQYDALDQLTGIEDKRRGHTEFTLNPNGQISVVRQRKTWETKASFVQLFGYDSELNLNQTGTGSEYSGNVVSMADERLKRQQRDYDKAGRVVKTGRFKYVYDECGRVTLKTEAKDGFRPQTTRFIWNDEDRLTHIELPDGRRYRYDPFGRRIAKECKRTQTATHYLWYGNTVVQQSKITADGTALSSTEYLYEPDTFRPLAQITTDHDSGRERLHYIVTIQIKKVMNQQPEFDIIRTEKVRKLLSKMES